MDNAPVESVLKASPLDTMSCVKRLQPADGSDVRAPISREQLEKMEKSEIIDCLTKLESDYAALKQQLAESGGAAERQSELVEQWTNKLKEQQQEGSRRENVLVMRLTQREQDIQDNMNKIDSLTKQRFKLPSPERFRRMLLDPAVSLMMQTLKKQADEAKAKEKQTQNELTSWKFTPDSQTGKMLMARCRTLLQENEELGRLTNSGRIAQLESEVNLQRTLVAEINQTQQDSEELLLETDQMAEGLQNTIMTLQMQLRDAYKEIASLKGQDFDDTLLPTIPQPVPPAANPAQMDTVTEERGATPVEDELAADSHDDLSAPMAVVNGSPTAAMAGDNDENARPTSLDANSSRVDESLSSPPAKRSRRSGNKEKRDRDKEKKEKSRTESERDKDKNKDKDKDRSYKDKDREKEKERAECNGNDHRTSRTSSSRRSDKERDKERTAASSGSSSRTRMGSSKARADDNSQPVNKGSHNSRTA